MPIDNLKAIIFDVHRTLVDDSGFPRENILLLLKQSGVNPDLAQYYRIYDDLTRRFFDWSKIKPYITIRQIHNNRLKRIYEFYDVKRDVEQDVHFLWENMGTSSIYPETDEVLAAVANKYKIALLSNADNDDPLIKILEKLDYSFDAVITSQDCKCYKPDPAIFEHTLKSLNLPKQQVVLVGDSPNSDIVGAKNFGIRMVWINRKDNKLNGKYPTPDYQISDLRELLKLIET